jgi:hypothetical protein
MTQQSVTRRWKEVSCSFEAVLQDQVQRWGSDKELLALLYQGYTVPSIHKASKTAKSDKRRCTGPAGAIGDLQRQAYGLHLSGRG